MQAAAEQVLNDVLLKYGSSSCDTPQMLETLLRKHGRACPKEVEVMTAALRCGVVSDLRTDKAVDPLSLARILARNARISQPQADWAVSAWSAALARAPTRLSTISGPDRTTQTRSPSPIRAATVLAVAIATGIIAYWAFCQ
jgi:hypothetical protein